MTKHFKWHFPEEKRPKEKGNRKMPSVTKSSESMPAKTAGLSADVLKKRGEYDEIVNGLSTDEMTVLTPGEGENTRLIAVNISRSASRLGKSDFINMVTYNGKVHVKLFTAEEVQASAERAAKREANAAAKEAETPSEAPARNGRVAQPVG